MSVLLRCGTRGYACATWRGPLYAPTQPPSSWLSTYAQAFDAVEIRSTEEALPNATTLQGWRAQVPEHFAFSLAAPLQAFAGSMPGGTPGDHRASRRAWERAAEVLGPHTLLRLAMPHYVKKDLPRLAALLGNLPRQPQWVVDLPDPSWHVDAAFALLRDHGVALEIQDKEGDGQPPLEMTGPCLYLRLRRPTYSAVALRRWRNWLSAQACRTAWLVVDCDDPLQRLHNAQQLATLLRDPQPQEVVGDAAAAPLPLPYAPRPRPRRRG